VLADPIDGFSELFRPARLEQYRKSSGSFRRRVVHGHKAWLGRAAYSSIADWFTLNSNELTWIGLVTFGVIAAGMLM
jgi:hypothetical protein